MALVARDVVGNKHPVAFFESLHTAAHTGDLSRHLVPQDAGGLLLPVPLHYVRPADAGRHHPDKYLVIRYARDGALLYAEVNIAVINGYFQKDRP